jgi:hypothetical protein
MKLYLACLRRASVGIPTSVFRPELWEGFGEALLMVFGTLVTFFACLLTIVTYPISVFVFAGILSYNERHRAKALAALDEQF